jgi:hypothetical protein
MRIPFLAAVLIVACSVPVWGQQAVIFYDDFETGDTTGWWAPARVGETGQATCYDEVGTVIACAGTGQDGDLRPGVAWPNPRFVDNGDGTVTDMLTGLVWLRNANCASISPAIWATALTNANTLASGACGLTDGSVAGQWRLPSLKELQSLVDYEYWYPALSNTEGTWQWTEGDAFVGIQSDDYWSSTSNVAGPQGAWYVHLGAGLVNAYFKARSYYVWPVRGGL